MTKRKVHRASMPAPVKYESKQKGKMPKQIHHRINGWKIGDYDAWDRDGLIVVGQLYHLNMETGIGTFKGFVIGDQTGQRREGLEMEWHNNLTLTEPRKVLDPWTRRYESFVRELYGNS